MPEINKNILHRLKKYCINKLFTVEKSYGVIL